MKSGLEIAQEANLRPITEIALAAGIADDELEPYGRYSGQGGALDPRSSRRPTRRQARDHDRDHADEGRRGQDDHVDLAHAGPRADREERRALPPRAVDGSGLRHQGGGTGGGYAQIVLMEDINLHFNGDFHAVTAAHNLLAGPRRVAVLRQPAGDRRGDDHVAAHARRQRPRAPPHGDRPGRKGPRRPAGERLRDHGGVEVMAVLALANDLPDLRALGRIVVASAHDGEPVTAEQLGVAGAMTVVMKDALEPNLVQTLEGQPVMVHAGPFGNVAHANNSIIEDSG